MIKVNGVLRQAVVRSQMNGGPSIGIVENLVHRTLEAVELDTLHVQRSMNEAGANVRLVISERDADSNLITTSIMPLIQFIGYSESDTLPGYVFVRGFVFNHSAGIKYNLSVELRRMGFINETQSDDISNYRLSEI